MKTIIVEKTKFLFDKFSEEILAFLRKQGLDYPSNFVVTRSDAEIKEGEHLRNFMKELEEGEELYFPFTTEGCSEPIKSADGTKYVSKDGEYVGGLGEIETAGYLISLEDGRFVIKSGLHSDNWRSGPSATPYENDVHFDGPMEKYIKQFIIK